MKPASQDEALMRQALRLARRAGHRGEVPIGAVVAREGRVIARASNATLRRQDPTAHAEVLALRRAARHVGNHRLGGLTLYVTLEPCLMCLGAMIQARVARCVYGANDPKVGAASLVHLPRIGGGINHRFPLEGGCLAEASAELLKGFFRVRRSRPSRVKSLP